MQIKCMQHYKNHYLLYFIFINLLFIYFWLSLNKLKVKEIFL